jgi:hypothetical protein
MHRLACITAALALAALAACNPYDPNLGTRPFKCGTNEPRCPEGYACTGTGTAAVCELTGATDAHPGGGGDASHVTCGTDTQLEPNDDIPNAVATPVRAISMDYPLARLAICPTTDVDMYAFTTSMLGQLARVTVTYDPSQGALELTLLNKQGLPVISGTPSGNQIVISYNKLSVDQWYVRVNAAVVGVQNNYDLDINVSP